MDSSYNDLTWECSVCQAIINDDCEAVKDLLEKVKLLNSSVCRSTWSCGRAPLHTAASLGNAKAINILASVGFNVNSYVDYGDGYRDTALALAVTCRHPETVKTLLDLGADFNLESSWFSMRAKPYEIAEHKGYQEIIDIFTRHLCKSQKQEQRKPTKSNKYAV